MSTEPPATSRSLRQHAAGPSRVSSSDVPREAHTIIEVVASHSRRVIAELSLLRPEHQTEGSGSRIEDCPRCMGRASIQVKLFSSPLPPVELYREGSAPHAERFGVTPPDRTGSRRGVSLFPIRCLR